MGLGASNTDSSPTPFCLATAPGPLAADRCSIVRGCSRPLPHLRHQAAPQLHPAVTAAGGEVSHPARSYGASWRSAGLTNKGQSRQRLRAGMGVLLPDKRSYASDRSQIPPPARRQVSSSPAPQSRLSPRPRSRVPSVRSAFPTGRDHSVCGDQPAMPRWRLVSRPVRVPGRSERCSSALGADPWLRRPRSVATRSTSACQRAERRRCAPGPLAEQAPCRCSCLPHGRPSPWRTSQAAWAAPLVGDPGAGRARAPPGAAPPARAVQPWRERVPTGAQAGVRPADRPRSGLGSCRTRRPAPARPRRRTQTDAIHDPSGRHGTAARRFLSRSGLRYATALSPSP